MSDAPAPKQSWFRWRPLTPAERYDALLLLLTLPLTPVIFFVVYMHGEALLAVLAPVLKAVGVALVLSYLLAMLMAAWALLVGLLGRP